LRSLVFRPKPIAAPADVPVRQCVDKFDDRLARGIVVVLIHAVDNGRQRGIQFAKNPTVELTTLGKGSAGRSFREIANVRRTFRLRIEFVDVCVDIKKAIDVP